jgi:hypothetical protein
LGSGNITLTHATLPKFVITESDQVADEKSWQLSVQNGDLFIGPVADAGGTGLGGLQIVRDSTASVVGYFFGVGYVALSGDRGGPARVDLAWSPLRTDSGIYEIADDHMGIAVSGVLAFEITPASLTKVTGTFEATGLATLDSATVTNDLNITSGDVIILAGQLGVGTAAPSFPVSIAASGQGAMSIASHVAGAGSTPILILDKSRNATVGSHTIVQDNDNLGGILFRGSNGASFDQAAKIEVEVDGTPGVSADMPGRMVFFTSADGSATPTERMRIDSSGNITVASLAGSGSRTVVADANGVLSAP